MQILECKECKKQFQSSKKDRKYCSVDCRKSAISNNTIEVNCSYCNKTFIRPSFTIRSSNLYCSKKCLNNHYSFINPERKVYSNDCTRIKKQLVKKRGNNCECCKKCNLAKYEIELHHIIPYNSFLNKNDANREDNLVLLCKKCHDKVHNKKI